MRRISAGMRRQQQKMKRVAKICSKKCHNGRKGCYKACMKKML